MRVLARRTGSTAAVAVAAAAAAATGAAGASALTAAGPASGTFRGSNNWLSFCGNVNESKLLSSAGAQARQLLPFGYDIYGLDAGWSTCESGDCSPVAPNFTDPKCCGVGHGMDEYGRALPNPVKYPSSGPGGALGFKPIIDKVHAMGLRFQLRMERGIAVEAVQQKTKVLGTSYTADEIVDWDKSCGKWGVSGGWGGVFVGINASHPGGIAYMQSVIDLWTLWGVDAIEADDYMGGQSDPSAHKYDCNAYPYYDEIDLLANAIRRSNPRMVLSIMPGNGAVPSDGRRIAEAHSTTAFRVTSDFHADNGGPGGGCANPAGCWGAPGASITTAPCDATDKGQVWRWQTHGSAPAEGSYVMPFSEGALTLSCRNDATHDCSAGDDLDLWYLVHTPNQQLNASVAPRVASDSGGSGGATGGVLQFARKNTCVSAPRGGPLRMAACNAQDAAQRWVAKPSGLIPGASSLQSVADPSVCIVGTGHQSGGGNAGANWPPAEQFSQAAAFASVVGVNGTFVNLDDLPLGHMTRQGCAPSSLGPCPWTPPQQRSVFTLYCVLRSPLMFSGDMPTDDATLEIVTHTEVLAVHSNSSNARQVSNVAAAGCTDAASTYKCSEVVWAADDGAGGQYAAVFWTGSGNRTVTVPLGAVRPAGGAARVRDVWARADFPGVVPAGGSLTAALQGGGVALFRLSTP